MIFMEKSHNSRYEKLFYKIENLLDNFDRSDRNTVLMMNEKELIPIFKLGLNRHLLLNSEIKMGGRKSRFKQIYNKIIQFPKFSKYWYENMEQLENKFAKSTIMKVLKIMVENISYFEL